MIRSRRITGSGRTSNHLYCHYGLTFDSLQAIDDSIGAFYWIGKGQVHEPMVGLDLNNNGNKTDSAVYTDIVAFKKNPRGLDLDVGRTNY